MIPWGRWFMILIGITMTIIGVSGVPLSVNAGNLFGTAVYTIIMFAGIGMLGYIAKE